MRKMQVNGPGSYNLVRKKSLAVSVACMAVYRPTQSFKGRTLKLCGSEGRWSIFKKVGSQVYTDHTQGMPGGTSWRMFDCVSVCSRVLCFTRNAGVAFNTYVARPIKLFSDLGPGLHAFTGGRPPSPGSARSLSPGGLATRSLTQIVDYSSRPKETSTEVCKNCMIDKHL